MTTLNNVDENPTNNDNTTKTPLLLFLGYQVDLAQSFEKASKSGLQDHIQEQRQLENHPDMQQQM